MITLGTGEEIQIQMRKHWFIIVADLFAYGVLYVLPIIFFIVVNGYEVPITEGGTVAIALTPAFATFLLATWTLILWMRVVGVWTDYYLDVWVVTDKRIIDLEQKGLFHRKSSVFRIERVQDVTVEAAGIIATLLDFGDLHVQTAGEAQEFVMRGIANPRRVREVILAQLDRATELSPRTPTQGEDAV